MPKNQTAPSLAAFRNPKRNKDSRRGRSGWYEYYAGFSPSFVYDALTLSGRDPGEARVLDPWNGSGTTTEIGARKGFDTIGFDLNPVMVIVAKARSLQENVQASVRSLLEEILLRAATIDGHFPDDPLAIWLSPETAMSIRRLEHALQTLLIDANEYTPLATLPSLSKVSALAGFFYVVLFRLLRSILKPFRSSNPTWIKEPSTPAERVFVTEKELSLLLRTQAAQMADDLAAESFVFASERMPRTHLDLASSLLLPLDDGSVQVVITSPPYCTRIDYVVKTGPELALLGLADTSALRQRMIGTPTIAKRSPTQSKSWGRTCLSLLDRVSCHGSRASKSYYLKTQLQYFDGLYNSLVEINRTLSDSAECFFVVQDSYYKEIRMDLAQIVKEMGQSVGWNCLSIRDFATSRTMVRLNQGAHAYNNPKLAIESVLHFNKVRAKR